MCAFHLYDTVISDDIKVAVEVAASSEALAQTVILNLSPARINSQLQLAGYTACMFVRNLHSWLPAAFRSRSSKGAAGQRE